MFVIVLLSLVHVGMRDSFSQSHGESHHNGREHHEDWPDSLQTTTVSGQAIVDRSHIHPFYFLDVQGDGAADYQLGFGPYWYEPESGATRPQDGEEVTVLGGLIDDHVPPLIVVFEINGLVWRDSTGGPPWSGGWVHRNASDTTDIFCPTDSLDWMGYPAQSMHGMMWPDSIYCQFEEMPVDSMLWVTDQNMFEGYYVENFRGRGGHMHGTGMMMGFNRNIDFRFHYDEGEMSRRGLSEASIQLHYLDGDFNWQVIPDATVDTEANTVRMSQSTVRTFYALSAANITSVEGPKPLSIPSEFTLQQNFPNPFNPQTTIRYKLEKDLEIELAIYDVRGRKVHELYRGKQRAGEHSLTWKGTDSHGRLVASGVYLARLKTDLGSQVRSMTLLR
jgi:hypothetical protein